MTAADKETVRTLLHISEKLNSTPDLTILMDDLVCEAISLVDAESGVSGLNTSRGMVCRKYFQKGTPLPLEYCWPPGHGLPGWLIEHKVPYITNDALNDTQIVHELCVRFGVHSALSTPILNAEKEVLGFFEIHNKKDGRGFTEEDKEKLLAVSHVAAIAIQNATAYQELRQVEKTQNLLASIVESSDDAIIGKTLESIITSWNKGAERIFGYTAEEAIGRSIIMLIPPDRRHEEEMILARLGQGDSIEHYETVRRRKDGTELDISLTISPIRDVDGRIVGASKIARDVSRQKQAERRLQESEERFAKAFNASPLSLTISSLKDGRLIEVNDTFTELTGYAREEAIGKTTAELGLWSKLTDREQEMEAVRQAGQVNNVEYSFRKRDGEELIGLLSAELIELGGEPCALTVIQDITARKQAEQALQEGTQRLTLALRSARLGDWSWDAATDMVTFSERAAEIFGIPPGPVMTWTEMRELIHDEDREDARIGVERAVAERSDYDIEYRIIRPDGGQLWVAAKGRATYDADGRVKGMLGIVQDVTDRKHEKAQLEEEREALEIINRVGQSLSAELDLDKLAQSLTDAATEITGAQFGSFFYNVMGERGASYMLYTLSGVPREHFENFPMPRATDLFGPTFRGEGVVRIADVKQDARYGKNAPYYGMPKGHLPVTSYLAIPVVSRSGGVIGGLFFGHSEPGIFTERHERIVAGLAGQAAIAMDNARLYEATQKARQEAETANRLKDEFLATVSHELRTPLNAIFGWSRMLSSGRLDEKSVARAIETIERNARVQEQIIEDILDVSRIITGKIRLDVSPVEIASVIDSAVDALRPTADARTVRLQTVIDTGPNLVLGDAVRLQQVVWNLVSNAIKFTPKGGRVQVTLERVNSHVELRVSDTGQGIKKDFLPYVFERFRQADSSTTREYGGLGLGLSIVRHLTELHGGSVAAESPGEGLGSTFIVRLPVAVMREGGTQPEQPYASRFHQAVTGEMPAEFGAELAGVRVLVVDDEADARELLTISLQQSGAEVRTAASTPQGLAVLKEWRPDVVVSDIGMPGLDGYALIREMRALRSDQGGDTPAIAVTAYARSEDRIKALRSGFQNHVAKPVEPTELFAIVAGLVRSHGRPKRGTDS